MAQTLTLTDMTEHTQNILANVVLILAMLGAIALFFVLIDFLGGYGAIISAILFISGIELILESAEKDRQNNNTK
jgi:divalent metal cation (Fe/Co/Zn/Cd) transporter